MDCTSGWTAARAVRPRVVRLAGAVLLAALTAGTTTAHAAEDPGEIRDLLDRMVRASRSLDYIGTFVYRNGATIQSMKVIHRAEPNGSRERLVALSGAAREVIRDGTRVICIMPDDRMVVVTRRRPGSLRPSTEFEPEVAVDSGIAERYSLSSAGEDRVAGREATAVDVRPRDEYRYRMRLAVDRETGLLLKSELLDHAMTVLEQIVYTHLELPESIPDAALEPRFSDAGFTRYEVPAVDRAGSGPGARTSEWSVGWLPAGFTLADESHGPIRPGRDPVDHRVYSDGLASLSIFIERGLDEEDRLEGLSSIGAVNAFGRVVGEYQISVVGEVPGITVEKVAASIVRQ